MSDEENKVAAEAEPTEKEILAADAEAEVAADVAEEEAPAEEEVAG